MLIPERTRDKGITPPGQLPKELRA